MIGIKGVGMAMLAEYFRGQGIEVVGSDTTEKFMTDEPLKKAGVKVIERFDKNNIPADADLIVYSTAYNAENNVEVAAVGVKKRARVLSYAEALAEVFNQKYGIAVIGSHGKTTTTAWLGYVLERAGKRPSVMVGSFVPQFNGLGIAGKSDYLVAELDEYQNKFQYFQPKAVLLNNIDYDHPDFFKTMADYENVFIEFIKKIPKNGFLVVNWDDATIRRVARVNCNGKVVSYAIDETADYVAYDIKPFDKLRVGKGGEYRQYFRVKLDDNEQNPPNPLYTKGAEGELGDFSIQLAGRHNISNALAVIAACIELGVELVDIKKYLEEFKGTARRMQVLGQFKGATIIDDYAHHPTEIKATLSGARQLYGDQKIIVIFHPHTFTRTKALLNGFAASFNNADEVIVLDIYGSAREEWGGINSADLVNKIRRQTTDDRRQKIIYIPTLNECEKYLREHINRGDVVLLMGAGDVFRIGENLMKTKLI